MLIALIHWKAYILKKAFPHRGRTMTLCSQRRSPYIVFHQRAWCHCNIIGNGIDSRSTGDLYSVILPRDVQHWIIQCSNKNNAHDIKTLLRATIYILSSLGWWNSLYPGWAGWSVEWLIAVVQWEASILLWGRKSCWTSYYCNMYIVGIRLSCQIMESHVVFSLVKARLEWPLQGASLGKGIWRLCAAHTTRPPPPSGPHWPDPRDFRAIHLGSVWLQELPEGSRRWHSAAWGTPLLICILDLLP